MTLRADFNADAACPVAKISVSLFRDSAELISLPLTVSAPEIPLAHAQSSAGHSPTVSPLQDPIAQIAIAFNSLREIETLLIAHAASQEPFLMCPPQFAMLPTILSSNATAEMFSIVLPTQCHRYVTAQELSPVELKTETTLNLELIDNAHA